MEVAKEKNKGASSFFKYCCAKGFQKSSIKVMEVHETNRDVTTGPKKKKPGGWRAMPYILGNETLERLTSAGLLANFMVYLMGEFHLEQVSAANLLNIWSGISNFAPLFGAFISDAYVGRFKTIAFAMCAGFLGMLTLTLTAWLPQLHPSKCYPEKPGFVDHCVKPSSAQLGVLLMGLGCITIATGGIRPCNIPFGVDQFDPTTEAGVKGISSFFNWYYTTFTVVILITLTLVVYIQDSVSWVLGFGIPTLLMFCAIVIFLIGTRIYVHVKPEGSIFSDIGQVFVAAYRKRGIKLFDDNLKGEKDKNDFYYDPPLTKKIVLSELPLTNQFRFLNKAAVIQENDLDSDGNRLNPWSLSTIQAVEEVKCLIRVIPISISGIVSLTAIVQQGTFTLSQALIMDRHLGPNFQIPAGSTSIISNITIVLWLPFYDTILVPNLRKITKHEGGITLLQRIGIGIVFSILSMVVAGIVEKERRSVALLHPNAQPMSVFWLAPQLILMGFCEAFSITGQVEFYNKQFPEHMRSIANALFSCSFAGANYLTTMVTVLVHRYTGTKHHPDWLTNNLNAGRLDYFYYVLAIMGVVNLVYFMYCAKRYRYKAVTTTVEEKSYSDGVELTSSKVEVYVHPIMLHWMLSALQDGK